MRQVLALMFLFLVRESYYRFHVRKFHKSYPPLLGLNPGTRVKLKISDFRLLSFAVLYRSLWYVLKAKPERHEATIMSKF